MSLFPAWFPAEYLFVGLVVFLVAVLLMNRGQWWVINVLAQDEPLVVAAGATIMAASGQIAESVGMEPETWIVIGAVTSLLGIVIWWSDDLDISGPL